MSSRLHPVVVPVIIIALVSGLGILFAQTSTSGPQQESFQRTFALNNGGALVIDNYKGTIHVTGSDGNQVVVDVRKKFDGSDSDRKWWMENTTVDFHNDSGRVEVKVKYPHQNCNFCWNDHSDYTAWVELEIRTPRQTNIDLNGYKPEIRLSSLQGDIRIKSYKSPMNIESTTGSIKIDTYKDSIRLRNVNVRGPLEVKSYKADAEIDARSLGDTARVENYRGSTVLRVPENTGLNVEFSGGRRASFHSDFPVNTSTRVGYGDSFSGTVNSGGTRLHLRTERGSVTLERLTGQ